MLQKNSEGKPTPKRQSATSQRFWYIALAGTLAACSYELIPLLQGQLPALQKLLVPVLLLAWLYRGSEWPRWLLTALMLGIGGMNLYQVIPLLEYGATRWIKALVYILIMLATGLYLALATRDFTRYQNYVAMRDGPRAAARKRAAERSGREGSAR